MLTANVPWKVSIDGADILVTNARFTCFGGANDPQDSGATASGISTKAHPELLGCALPMRRDASKYLRGSPMPRLPWGISVVFSSGDKEVTTKLVDEGPALYTGNAGDLTIAAARMFHPKASATNFEERGTIRVLNGAKYL